jgi:hypothetical protein
MSRERKTAGVVSATGVADDAKDGVPKSMVVWQGTKDNATDPSQFGSVVLSNENHNPLK